MSKSKGGVSKKTINGKEYYYFQWMEDGKRRSRTISKEEYLSLLEDSKTTAALNLSNTRFHGIKMLIGEELLPSLKYLEHWNKRDAFSILNDYLDTPLNGKVLILYGLRRTGKTTMMFQSILERKNDIDKCVYLSVDESSNIGELNILLDELSRLGFKYIFIDEITKLGDFISSSQFLSDIYAFKMKLVLSGTDSLGFMIANDDALYNRSYMIHTTYLSFKEYSRVLNINDIDKYIEYGGTLVAEGINYHTGEAPTFYDENSSISYIDTSICKNIQRSLTYYRDGDNFNRIRAIKDRDELTNIINRIVQDENHRFVKEVVNSVFKSQTYGSLKELLRKNKRFDKLRTIVDEMDEKKIYEDLMNRIDVSNNSYKVDDETLIELNAYLRLLDVIDRIDVVDIETGLVRKRNVFVQPGLRYSIAKELIQSLMEEPIIRKLPDEMSNFIYETLLNDTKGRILEEIVLIDEKERNECKSFKASFAIGEIDMVKYIKESNSFSLYEIKHSMEIDDNQIKHLIDEEKLGVLKYRYGKLDNRFVLYKGKNKEYKNIKYLNVEEYLKR